MTLTQATVVELVQLYDNGAELPELAERYGVTRSTVSRIITGQTWQEVTGGKNRSRVGQTAEYRAAYIQARLEQGCRNYKTIADELGVTRQAVAKMVKKKGLGGNSCSAV